MGKLGHDATHRPVQVQRATVDIQLVQFVAAAGLLCRLRWACAVTVTVTVTVQNGLLRHDDAPCSELFIGQQLIGVACFVYGVCEFVGDRPPALTVSRAPG